MKYLYVDLYTGETSVVLKEDYEDAISGLEMVDGELTSWKGEEYMVIEVPSKK